MLHGYLPLLIILAVLSGFAAFLILSDILFKTLEPGPAPREDPHLPFRVWVPKGVPSSQWRSSSKVFLVYNPFWEPRADGRYAFGRFLKWGNQCSACFSSAATATKQVVPSKQQTLDIGFFVLFTTYLHRTTSLKLDEYYPVCSACLRGLRTRRLIRFHADWKFLRWLQITIPNLEYADWFQEANSAFILSRGHDIRRVTSELEHMTTPPAVRFAPKN
jgi:hypothetical protein